MYANELRSRYSKMSRQPTQAELIRAARTRREPAAFGCTKDRYKLHRMWPSKMILKKERKEHILPIVCILMYFNVF